MLGRSFASSFCAGAHCANSGLATKCAKALVSEGVFAHVAPKTRAIACVLRPKNFREIRPFPTTRRRQRVRVGGGSSSAPLERQLHAVRRRRIPLLRLSGRRSRCSDDESAPQEHADEHNGDGGTSRTRGRESIETPRWSPAIQWDLAKIGCVLLVALPSPFLVRQIFHFLFRLQFQRRNLLPHPKKSLGTHVSLCICMYHR